MIVRNEGWILSRCLASVRALVDEIIVVDTGSTDQTVEIAESFGARVYHATWENDFSKARNISLQHATKDWILVLDADEEIRTADHNLIKTLTETPGACYLLNQRHYTDDLRFNNSVSCQGEHSDMERGHQGYFQSPLARLCDAIYLAALGALNSTNGGFNSSLWIHTRVEGAPCRNKGTAVYRAWY